VSVSVAADLVLTGESAPSTLSSRKRRSGEGGTTAEAPPRSIDPNVCSGVDVDMLEQPDSLRLAARLPKIIR
jgi:hypothetical protein